MLKIYLTNVKIFNTEIKNLNSVIAFDNLQDNRLKYLPLETEAIICI